MPVNNGSQNDRSLNDRSPHEWFAVATTQDVALATAHPFVLMGGRYVLLRSSAGEVSVFEDSCPHRGAQLSLGRFDGSQLRCPYHGWEFDTGGRCVHRPAHPGATIPEGCSLSRIAVTEAFGLWWVCLGGEPRNLPEYPAFAEYPGLTVTFGPQLLETSGPRAVENFLDVAHFPFVHDTYLGEWPHTEVRDYEVTVSETGVLATNVVAWQPRPGPTATEGGDVAYVYSVTHPYTAVLTKVPSESNGGELHGFSMMIVASPVSETVCRVWMLTTIRDPDGDLGGYRAFNEVIFSQDTPVVESQLPKRLPLDPSAETHQRADRLSLAYRRWLLARGIGYGTC
jgi:phenylpropionate dioxygenase-like ring-hydroxylating dioxygenase large terminal subunit